MFLDFFVIIRFKLEQRVCLQTLRARAVSVRLISSPRAAHPQVVFLYNRKFGVISYYTKNNPEMWSIELATNSELSVLFIYYHNVCNKFLFIFYHFICSIIFFYNVSDIFKSDSVHDFFFFCCHNIISQFAFI